MFIPRANFFRLVFAAALSLPGTVVPAQLLDSTQAIEMEADSTSADARSGALIFTRISVRQGALKISADTAESSALGFEDSVWSFTGDVNITSPTAQLTARSLILEFSDGQLKTARIQGAPLRYVSSGKDDTAVSAATATVQVGNGLIRTIALAGQPIDISRLNKDTGKTSRGRAEQINYDATTRNLDLTGNAELNENGNMITGNVITYNLGDQTVKASANQQGSDRVHITILPKDNTPANPAAPETNPTTPESPDSDASDIEQ